MSVFSERSRDRSSASGTLYSRWQLYSFSHSLLNSCCWVMNGVGDVFVLLMMVVLLLLLLFVSSFVEDGGVVAVAAVCV